LSGGAHARRGMDIQDFLAVPVGATDLDSALGSVAAVRVAAARILESQGKSLLLADEGGFSPGYANTREGLDLMVRAIESAGLSPGADVAIALDVAATQLVTPDGAYQLRRAGRTLRPSEMAEEVARWIDDYPVVSVEDPLAEDDWQTWQTFNARLGSHVQVLGDDLFCTNPGRIQRGIQVGAANAVLIKVNQIGTVSGALDALRLARSAGMRTVVSARSGETEDSFIADLATGSAAGQIKVGSLTSSERLAKYNQLVRIQEQLGVQHFSRRVFASARGTAGMRSKDTAQQGA
jgi:enolase